MMDYEMYNHRKYENQLTSLKTERGVHLDELLFKKEKRKKIPEKKLIK